MTQHIEGGLGLVSRDHVSGMIDQHKPEVAIDLDPALNCPIDGPYFFGSPLPHRYVSPVQIIEIV